MRLNIPVLLLLQTAPTAAPCAVESGAHALRAPRQLLQGPAQLLPFAVEHLTLVGAAAHGSAALRQWLQGMVCPLRF